MVVMWIVLVGGVVVVAVVAAAVARRRPRSTDLSSVRRYHSALGTIEAVSERTGSAGPGAADGAGRTVVPAPVPPAGLEAPWVPPVPVRGSGAFPDPGAPLVFDDALPPGDQRGELAPAPRARTDRIQKQALHSMNHRPRRGSSVALVTAVVVVLGVLVVLGVTRSSKGQAHSAGTAPDATTSSAPVRAADVTTTSGAARATRHTSRHRAGSHPTTTPAPTQIVAVTSAPGAATYPVAAASYDVSVTASGTCWVLARSASSGATLWTGTLQAGAVQVIPATGVTTVEVGAPTVSLAVGTLPVVLPAPLHTPFVATFQPAPGSASTTGSSTSTTATG
jgi:hypothetical protein